MQHGKFFALLLFWGAGFCDCPLKPHEIWWEACVGPQTSYEHFEWSLGETNCLSRVAMRKHVKNMGYQSILDVPSALCLDYFGFVQEKYPIDYLGVDITPKFISLAKTNGISALQGSIEKLPVKENSYDVCYARHILEHLKSYERAIDELIRVAKNEVLVVFFMIPQSSPNLQLEYHDGYLIYHNIYSKNELEEYIKANPKVARLEWEHLPQDGPRVEAFLHIYLNRENLEEELS